MENKNNINNTQRQNNLANMMSEENIMLTYANTPTAYFDLNQRKLVIPTWKGLTDIETDMIIGHEIGHALYTPNSWTKCIEGFKKNKNVFKNILNIVEDARIERKVKARFPGMKKIFVYGYDDLFNRGLFDGLKKDKNLCLLDQLNVQYKIPNKIVFAKDKMFDHFYSLMGQTTDFQSVVALSKKLYDYCEQEFENNSNDNQSDSNQNSDELGNNSNTNSQNNQSDENSNENSEQNDNSNNNSKQTDDENKNSQSVNGQGELQKGDDKSENTNGGIGSGAGMGADESFEKEYGVNKLDKNLQEFLTSINKTNNHTHYFMDSAVLKNVIIPVETLLSEIDSFGHIDTTSYENIKRSQKSLVNYYTKIFQMKKKAKEYNKTLKYKTGKLNNNKLVNFKFDNDIFMTSELKHKGKNHGLIFIIDLSGSMSGIITKVYKKLLETIMFCRNNNIPVSVYGFTDINKGHSIHEPCGAFKNTKDCRFKLIEIINPSLKNKQIDTIFNALIGSNNISYGDRRTTNFNSLFCTGGTPLIPAIACTDELVKKMREETKAEIINIVFFTDGDDGHGPNQFYSEKAGYTNNYYTYTSTHLTDIVSKTTINTSYIDTKTIIEMMKKRPAMKNVNMVNFFIHDSHNSACFKVCDENNSRGFDEEYKVFRDYFEQNTSIDNLGISSTIKNIKSKFYQHAKKKKQQQILVNKFIDKIA